jgi:hypothetical protein
MDGELPTLVRAMWQWACDLDRDNLLWREFCRPIEIETGSKEDLAIQLTDGWIVGCSRKKTRDERSLANTTDGRKNTPTTTSMGDFLFFRHLQNERSDLLDFRASDNDKWQTVHGWLRDWVKD